MPTSHEIWLAHRRKEIGVKNKEQKYKSAKLSIIHYQLSTNFQKNLING